MAMRNGQISFVAPFRYTGMIWAILFGFLLFGDLPDMTTIFGTIIVVGMGSYALHREQSAPTGRIDLVFHLQFG